MENYKIPTNKIQINDERSHATNLDLQILLSDAVLISSPDKILGAFYNLKIHAEKYPDHFTLAELQYLYGNLNGQSNFVRYFYELLEILARKPECIDRIFGEELQHIIF